MSKLIDELLTQTEGYNVSDKYEPIPTADIILEMERFGFETTDISLANVMKEEKQGHQRHIIRMSTDMRMFGEGIRPEVVIKNSYDRSSALEIRIGMWRMVCANGIIAGTNLIPALKIRHMGEWQSKLHAFIDTYEEKFKMQVDWVDNMKATKMSLDDAYGIAEQALNFRHYDKRIENTAVDPLELLIAKRKEDRGDSAWERFNVIQESLMNGYYNKYNAEGKIQKAKVITNTDEIVRVNITLSDTFGEFVS